MERNEDLNEALATVDAMVAVCCFFDVYKMRKGHTILINKVYDMRHTALILKVA